MKLMSINKKFLMLSLCSTLLFVNCLKNPVAVNEGLGDTGIIFFIDVDYPTDDSLPIPRIRFYTTKTYSCFNLKIETVIHIMENTIRVDFQGISHPGICLDALGPARYQASLPLHNGDYTLILRDRSLVDKYSLTLDEKSIVVRALQTPLFTTAGNPIEVHYPLKRRKS